MHNIALLARNSVMAMPIDRSYKMLGHFQLPQADEVQSIRRIMFCQDDRFAGGAPSPLPFLEFRCSACMLPLSDLNTYHQVRPRSVLLKVHEQR